MFSKKDRLLTHNELERFTEEIVSMPIENLNLNVVLYLKISGKSNYEGVEWNTFYLN